MVWWVVWLMVLISGPAALAFDVSPAFLGMYRKTIETDADIFDYSERHGIDPRMARALILYESGGNREWVSESGVTGYFQLPSGLVSMFGDVNRVEVGIKYLAHLQQQFEREDYLLAAFKAGPDRIVEGAPLHFEVVQYVVGVGAYKVLLQEHGAEVRRQAKGLRLLRAGRRDTWKSVSRRVQLTGTALRLYNPVLAQRSLREGALVVYPGEVPSYLVDLGRERKEYRARVGDRAKLLAGVFGIDEDSFYARYDILRLQALTPGMRIMLPDTRLRAVSRRSKSKKTGSDRRILNTLAGADENNTAHRHRIVSGDTLGKIARRYGTTVRTLRRVNGLGGTRIQIGNFLRIPVTGKETVIAYRVRSGDTLSEIAMSHGVTVKALVRANHLRTHRIRIGTILQIPIW